MKKVGILTHYYNGTNYGGTLQAYALCKVLNNNGYYAEQICYLYTPAKQFESVWQKIKRKGLINVISLMFSKIKSKFNGSKISRIKKLKHNAFYNFNNNIIPHGEEVYTDQTIAKANALYHAFITGSDQVWNGYNYAYFLDFVDGEKIRLSYSASLGRNVLTQGQKEQFKKSLKDYKAISLREKEGLELVKDLCPFEPCITVDPVLLLDKEEWDKICAPQMESQEYMFCYFLGLNKKLRKLAKSFAKKKGLKIISIPMAESGTAKMDDFADTKIADATPEQFISLIKHAKYVFTDSFHAVVFSNIYKKEYFVFNRNKRGEMNDRIFNITRLFNQQQRFCNGKDRETLEYIFNEPNLDYSNKNQDFEQMKKESIKFLTQNLG